MGSVVLGDVSSSQVLDLGQATHLGAHLLVELLYLGFEVLLYFLVSFAASLVAEVGDREVALEFFLALPYSIFLEASAVIVFIEDSNPTGNQIQRLHLFDLVRFLLPLRKPLVRSELVDVAHDPLFLFRQQIYQNILDSLGVLK